MKPGILLLLILAFLFGCAHQDVSNSPSASLPPDLNCSQYEGTMCVTPVVNLPPDSMCSQYQGATCVMMKVQLAPDESCSLYDGTVCVTPSIH